MKGNLIKSIARIAVAMIVTVTLVYTAIALSPVSAQSTNTITVTLGVDRATLAKAKVSNNDAVLGQGSWFVSSCPNMYDKMEMYIDPTKPPFDSLGTFKIDDIQSISYKTKKPGAQGDPDFYLVLYTEKDGVDDTGTWYGYRLNAEPYYSKNLNAPANRWNTWSTDPGTNQLTFFDSAKTGTYGFYGQPTLQELQAREIKWPNSDQFIDYGKEIIKYISFQTGSGWCDTFTGYLDAIQISLKNGTSLTIDLESFYQETWVDDDANNDWYLTPGHFKTIQAAIDATAPGGVVNVYPGTYKENITINKNIKLISTQGRESTVIEGISGLGALGTIVVTNNTSGVQIGDVEKGFKIIGIDNGNPGIENAALYFQGNHSNAVIKGNEIVANGDHGLLTESSATISGFVIDSNVFSGKTFEGDKPGGDGFANQFTEYNVPRQLVVISGGRGGGNTSNITFTNNKITGTAGGYNPNGAPQGNTLVTIDSQISTIENNTFEGTTTCYATSLRVRGPNASIKNNIFKSTGLTPTTGHLYLENNPLNNALISNNTFDKGVYVENNNGGVIGVAINPYIQALPPNSVVRVLAGTYNEELEIYKSIQILGPNENISPNSGTRGKEAVIVPNDESNKSDTAVWIKASNISVTLKGFTFDLSNTHEQNDRFIESINQTGNTLHFEKNIFTGAPETINGNWYITGTTTGTSISIIDNRFHHNGVSNGIALWGNDHQVEIRDNVWKDNQGWAINVNNVKGTISHNRILDTEENGTEWYEEQAGFLFASNLDISITENEFDGLPNPFIRIYPNAEGSIKISGNVFSNAEDQTIGVIRTTADLSKLTLTIEKNAFINNPINIQNLVSGSLIKAERNWWGSKQGPTGGQFVGDVDYDPWLCDGTDSQLDVIGFQPAASAETCTNYPTRLRFVVQPPNPVFTSEPFGVKVRVEDAQGNLGVNYDNTISLSLANNPVGGSLGGTLAQDPSMGYAEFTDLFINKAGVGYRLLAASGSLNSAYSNFFDVADPSADLSLSLSAPASVNAGASFAYTLTVSNDGPKAATTLTLTLTLPAGVTYQSTSGDGWTCAHSAGVVTCNRATLADSASSTVTVIVTAPVQPGDISARATIGAVSPADPDPSNNSDETTTTVVVLPPTGGFQVFLPLVSR